jgi:hypothetical protein
VTDRRRSQRRLATSESKGLQELSILELFRTSTANRDDFVRDEQRISSGVVEGLNCRVADLCVGVKSDDQDE